MKPLQLICQRIVLAQGDSIHHGKLRVVMADGKELSYGNAESVLKIGEGSTDVCVKDKWSADLYVRDNMFWVRVALFAGVGFATSCMLGEVECSSLYDFFQIFTVNNHFATSISLLGHTLSRWLRPLNRPNIALLNVAQHYDLSNRMFEAFLSEEMTYSCAFWAPGNEDSLHIAQLRKLDAIIAKASLRDTDHVLEFGSGWGSFAIRAVQITGCKVTTVTLSQKQKEGAEENIRKAGVADRIQVILSDYRHIPIPKKRYDKIVAIEMIEHCGKEYLETFFSRVDQLLNVDDGIAVFQVNTIPESRFSLYKREDDFIRRYIFPGTFCPSTSHLANTLRKASKGKLDIESIENIAGHYPKTLRLWKEKFLEVFESDILPALKREHGWVHERDAAIFKRKWEYYFTYCDVAYGTGLMNLVWITVGREGACRRAERI